MASVTAAQRVRPFMGRESELRALSDLLQGDETRVACLHGIAGVGKSGLVRAFLERARGDGLDRRCCSTAGRSSRPSAGSSRPLAVSTTSRRSSGMCGGVRRRSCSSLDHYEVFRLMDTWLRQVLVPALPAGAGLLLAGRERPVGAWFSLERFRTLPLGPLEDADALAVLEHHGIRAGDAARLNRIARGHPLALMLASAGVSEHPELEIEDAAMTRVVERARRGATSRRWTTRSRAGRSRRPRSCGGSPRRCSRP